MSRNQLKEFNIPEHGSRSVRMREKWISLGENGASVLQKLILGSQGGPKMEPRWLKMEARWLKMGPRWFKMEPRGAQDGAKMAQGRRKKEEIRKKKEERRKKGRRNKEKSRGCESVSKKEEQEPRQTQNKKNLYIKTPDQPHLRHHISIAV